jgi:phosphoglycolate phosphatase
MSPNLWLTGEIRILGKIMRANALLFDKDGTLFDFQKTWAPWAANMIKQRSAGDAQLADKLALALGYDLTNKRYLRHSVVIAGTAMETVDAIIDFFPDMTAAQLEKEFGVEQGVITPCEAIPLRPFLQAMIDKGLRLGIATNDGEASARAQLDHFAVTDLFEYIAGYDSGFGGKPGPGMCIGFAKATGIHPSQIAMIGDSLHDLHAGRAAGMQCVGVLTGVAIAADLAPHADIVLPDIGHLKEWLTT